MARDFRSSRFRRRGSVGEDVNPSAYIVNLADCMLVLACGFLVALISLHGIDLGPTTEQVDEADLQEVDPNSVSEDLTDEGGAGYEDAGRAFRDPNTGQLYIVKENNDQGASASGQDSSATAGSGDGSQAQGNADGSFGSSSGDSDEQAASGAQDSGQTSTDGSQNASGSESDGTGVGQGGQNAEGSGN